MKIPCREGQYSSDYYFHSKNYSSVTNASAGVLKCEAIYSTEPWNYQRDTYMIRKMPTVSEP